MSPSRITSQGFPSLFLNRSLLDGGSRLMLWLFLFYLSFHLNILFYKTVFRRKENRTLFRLQYTTLTFGIWEKNILESKAETILFFFCRNIWKILFFPLKDASLHKYQIMNMCEISRTTLLDIFVNLSIAEKRTPAVGP